MIRNSDIEIFFKALDFTWQDLIEFLPLGIIFFDENWEIKSVNRNLTDYFEGEWLDVKLEGSNLFSNDIFAKHLPANDILMLKDGKHFVTQISYQNKLKDKIKLLVKGSPIFKNGIFKGGTLTIENYSAIEADVEDLELDSNTFLAFLKNICKCFLIIDTAGIIKYTSFSERHKCYFLKGKENLSITSLYEARHKNPIEKTIQQVLSKKNQNSLELEYYSENEKFIFNNIFIPLKDNSNNVKAIIVFMKEQNDEQVDGISYLSNAEKFKEYYAFAKFNSDAMFKINLKGNITYWADNAESLFKVSNKEVLSKFIGELFPEINRNYFDTIREEILLNNWWEQLLKYKTEEENIIVQTKIVLVKDNNKELFVYCNKIDPRRQKILSAKEEEKEFFRDTVIKADEMILQANPNGTILFANEKFCNEFNFELDEIRGVNFSDIIEPNFRLRNKITDFFSSIHKGVLEIIPLVAKSGKIIEVCPSVNISTVAGDLKYFTIYLHNCNKEEKLFLDTAHALLYQASEAIVIIYNNRIVKVNPKFLDLFNSKYETDYYNKEIIEIVNPEYHEEFKNFVNNRGASALDENIKFIKSDSSEFEAEIKKIYSSLDTNYSVISVNPTTEQKSSETEKLNYIKKLIANLDEYLWSAKVKENRMHINFISPEISDAFGYTHVEFISQPDFWKEIIHPDDQEKVNSLILDLLHDSNVLQKELTYRIINKNGEVVWINNNLKIIRDKQGNAIEVLGSIRDVTESAKEKEKLINKVNELEKLNNTKDKFISIISHDLKSPFTSIVGFSDLILSDTTLEKEVMREYVSNIRDASMHTVDLLNGLLDWTRLQTGRMEITPTIISAKYITNKTVELLSGIAYQKGLTLSAYVDDSIYINADENLIFQVFNNLIANSIKFTPKGGSIDIYASKLEDQQRVQFVVKDTGVGIEQEDLAKLFVVDKKFTTLGTDGERGTGLGLSLVKEIIEKHNGQISVKSEINKGTEFIFTLPISSPSILLFDTMQAERILYSKLLESITQGIEIIQANNIESTLRIVREKKPMLVISEHNLDEIKGIEFVETLRNSEINYKPSIFIFARNISKEDIYTYQKLGIDNVFKKPIDLKGFKSKLDSVIGKNT